MKEIIEEKNEQNELIKIHFILLDMKSSIQEEKLSWKKQKIQTLKEELKKNQSQDLLEAWAHIKFLEDKLS